MNMTETPAALKYRVISGYSPRIFAGIIYPFEQLGELSTGDIITVDKLETTESGLVWAHIRGDGWVLENLLEALPEKPHY